MDARKFQHYLSTGEYVPAEDAAPTSLAAHDKRFHPKGFDPKKDHCEFREKRAKQDESDIIASSVLGSADGNKKPWEREYDEVVAKYKGTDKWLKAPNGKPTNLTEHQWVQVRTPSFKAWFGDWEKDPANASKVIDSNGEPLVVWHGLKIKDAEPLVDGNDVRFVPKFKVFKTKKEIERGAYFAAEKGRAEPYSEAGFTASFFLNIRNPLITERTLSKKPKGSDGAYRDQVGLGKEWVAFSPDQIKSATDNSGAFSPEKENIMDGAADAPRKPSLRDIAAAAMAEDEDLEAHDRRFHGGQFDPDTQTCGLREGMAKSDDADLLAKDVTFEDNDDNFSLLSGGVKIGGCNYTFGWPEDIEEEYSDSVEDFNSSALMPRLGFGGKVMNIEDVWVDEKFRNKGHSADILQHAIELAGRKGATGIVLRAHSDAGIPTEVLEKIYSRHGFETVQQTDEDGTIMYRKMDANT